MMSMRLTSLRWLTAGLAVIAAGVSSSALAHHQPGHHGSEHAACDCPEGVELVGEAWVRLMPPGQATTAAFMTLRNTTSETLRIVSAESPVARVTELHTHEDDGGVMRMREVEAIEIPAEGEVELRPGGLHVMLIDLVEPLAEGQVVPITLFVEGHQDLQVDAVVRPMMGAHGGGQGHGHQGHGHRGH